MTGAVKETIYKAAFQSRIAGANQPAWLRELREKAFADFAEKGFPTPSNEEWKYTNVASIADGPWSIAGTATEDFSSLVFNECEKSVLVFRNGSFSKSESRLSALEDAVVLTFNEALADQKYSSILRIETR